jgi:hypothetical protein
VFLSFHFVLKVQTILFLFYYSIYFSTKRKHFIFVMDLQTYTKLCCALCFKAWNISIMEMYHHHLLFRFNPPHLWNWCCKTRAYVNDHYHSSSLSHKNINRSIFFLGTTPSMHRFKFVSKIWTICEQIKCLLKINLYLL